MYYSFLFKFIVILHTHKKGLMEWKSFQVPIITVSQKSYTEQWYNMYQISNFDMDHMQSTFPLPIVSPPPKKKKKIIQTKYA